MCCRGSGCCSWVRILLGARLRFLERCLGRERFRGRDLGGGGGWVLGRISDVLSVFYRVRIVL